MAAAGTKSMKASVALFYRAPSPRRVCLHYFAARWRCAVVVERYFVVNGVRSADTVNNKKRSTVLGTIVTNSSINTILQIRSSCLSSVASWACNAVISARNFCSTAALCRCCNRFWRFAFMTVGTLLALGMLDFVCLNELRPCRFWNM